MRKQGAINRGWSLAGLTAAPLGTTSSVIDDGPSAEQRAGRARWLQALERRQAAERERTESRKMLRLKAKLSQTRSGR